MVEEDVGVTLTVALGRFLEGNLIEWLREQFALFVRKVGPVGSG